MIFILTVSSYRRAGLTVLPERLLLLLAGWRTVTILCRNILISGCFALFHLFGICAYAMFPSSGPVRASLLYCDAKIAVWVSEDGESINVQTFWPQCDSEKPAVDLHTSYPLADVGLPSLKGAMQLGGGAIAAFVGSGDSQSWLYLAANGELYRIEYKNNLNQTRDSYLFEFAGRGEIMHHFSFITCLHSLQKDRKVKDHGPFNLIVVDENKMYLINDERKAHYTPLRVTTTVSMESDIKGVEMLGKGLLVAMKNKLKFYKRKDLNEIDFSEFQEISIQDLISSIKLAKNCNPYDYLSLDMDMDEGGALIESIRDKAEIKSLTYSEPYGYMIIATSAGLLVSNRSSSWAHVVPSTEPHGKTKHLNVEVAYVDQWIGIDTDPVIYAFRRSRRIQEPCDVMRIKLPQLDSNDYTWPDCGGINSSTDVLNRFVKGKSDTVPHICSSPASPFRFSPSLKRRRSNYTDEEKEWFTKQRLSSSTPNNSSSQEAMATEVLQLTPVFRAPHSVKVENTLKIREGIHTSPKSGIISPPDFLKAGTQQLLRTEPASGWGLANKSIVDEDSVLMSFPILPISTYQQNMQKR